MKQASRRSWRIGQDKPVKVIFMAYKDTPQHKALELIGAKVAAANSLEGRLSGDDDLSSMGEDDDNIQLALAKAILNGESSSADIKTTTIKNFGNDRGWDAFEAHYMSMMETFKDREVVEAFDDLISDSYFDDVVKQESYSKDEIEVLLDGVKTVEELKENIQTSGAPKFHSLLDYDGEITSTFAYYVGKGKNQKRIEVDAANLADYIPQEKLAGGIQLSLF